MSETIFEATRAAGLARLQAFVPRAGSAYAAERNYDNGPGQHAAVSSLSPYLRTRLIREDEVLQAVLRRFSHKTAGKFIQEVFWRTYFKGWLEQRPDVWRSYIAGRAQAWDHLQVNAGQRAMWQDACTGQTGIACFDAWAHELVQTGFLHNHARMWFASIWIFTLRLPWQLGADFFLRHLLDGDPASNTLSWRWVGGLHTQGKHYLARPSNIKRYTQGRFDPSGQLAEDALPLQFTPHPARRVVPSDTPMHAGVTTALILHDDDLDPGFILKGGAAPVATCALETRSALSHLQVAPQVTDFASKSLGDSLSRWHARLGAIAHTDGLEPLVQWAKGTGAKVIVAPYAPVGPAQDILTALGPRLAQNDQALVLRMRSYDSAAWPYATAGFFKFKEKIPQLIADRGAWTA